MVQEMVGTVDSRDVKMEELEEIEWELGKEGIENGTQASVGAFSENILLNPSLNRFGNRHRVGGSNPGYLGSLS